MEFPSYLIFSLIDITMAKLTSVAVLAASILGLGIAHPHIEDRPTKQLPLEDPVPLSTRAHWMRQANLALNAPCPFAAFGAVIVNHTATTGLGTLICSGANANSATGNPTHHGTSTTHPTNTPKGNPLAGEMVAIHTCSALLTDPAGPYRLSPAAALAALSDLTLYTNAESCPMCASAIRWAGFREYVYGTSIDTLMEKGWRQIRIASAEVVAQSHDLGKPVRMLGGVLTAETDPYLAWQFDPAAGCPGGCVRVEEGGCEAGPG